MPCTSSLNSFRNDIYQFIQLIYKQDVPVRSFHSRMTCTSSFNLFTNEIYLSLRVRLKNKSVHEGYICSKHSTNHMLRFVHEHIINYLKHDGTSHSSSDLLKIFVKMGASWLAQDLRQAGDTVWSWCFPYFVLSEDLAHIIITYFHCRFGGEGVCWRC